MAMNWKFWKNNKPTNKVHSFENKTKWTFNQKYNFTQPEINVNSTGEFIPFGMDNLYPQMLLQMYKSSPFHNAIVEFKTISAIGDGINVIAKDTLEGKILKKKIENKFNNRLLKRIIKEYIIHNRLYFKVKPIAPGLKFDLVPAEFVRNSTKIEDGRLINMDWGKNRNNFEKIRLYDKFNNEENQLIEYTDDSPGTYIYPVPYYSAASNWIWLDGEIAYFQKQNMENSVNPSMIVKIYEDIEDPELKQEWVESFKRSYEGARNAGKTFIVFSNGKDLAPDFIQSDPNKLDAAFADTQENIIKNVSYSHLLNPILMGISTEGKLGASNEINAAYELYRINYLNNLQNEIEYFLNDLLYKLGVDAKIEIIRSNVKLDEGNKNIELKWEK